MDYEIKIKTLADVQALENTIKELDALEKQAKDYGNETKELSQRIARLDAAMDSSAAVAIRQAAGWEDGAKALEKLGQASAAAELRLSGSRLLKSAGLDPETALVGEADKKRAGREMAALDRQEKRRDEMLAKELANNQKRTQKRIEAESDPAAGTGPRGAFSLGGFVARAFGFGVGASAGAALAHGAIRDFMAELKEAFGKQNGVAASVGGVKDAFSNLINTVAQGVAETGAFQKVASFTATTLTSWKMAVQALFPGQEKFESLTAKNEDATRRFVTQLERAIKQQEEYEKKVEKTNARLRLQLAGLMAVKKAADAVDDAQAQYEKGLIDEEERRGRISKEDADTARRGVDSRADARRYAGDHAAKEAEKESAGKDVEAARQSLAEKKRELEMVKAQVEGFGKNVDSENAGVRSAAADKMRAKIRQHAVNTSVGGFGGVGMPAADPERPFTPYELDKIEEEVRIFQARQKTTNYAATRDRARKLQEEVDAGEKRLASAEGAFGEKNVELGGMEQVRAKSVATQNIRYMSDTQLDAATREIIRFTRNLPGFTNALEKGNRTIEDEKARSANRRAF